MLIRRPTIEDFIEVDRLRTAIVNEVYGGLWSSSPLVVGAEDWTGAWIAIAEPQVAGILLTREDRLEDLWIASPYRGQGIGAELLACGETEIAERNHEFGHLRVVKANRRAISFYNHHGWQLERDFLHETLPTQMLELTKRLKNAAMQPTSFRDKRLL